MSVAAGRNPSATESASADTDAVHGRQPWSEAGEELTRLYAQHRQPLYAFCLARTNDPDAADDIVQEAFVKAYTNYGRFDTGRPFWPWLASIAARLCIDHHRRQGYARSRVDDIGLDMGATNAADPTASAVLEAVDWARLRAEFGRLPVRQATALQLFAVDGWSYTEIASQLGASVGNVRVLLARARRALREATARSLVAAGGCVRALRARWAGVAHRLPAPTAWGESVGAWVSAVGAAMPVVSLVVVAASFLVPVEETGSVATEAGAAPRWRPAAAPAPAAPGQAEAAVGVGGPGGAAARPSFRPPTGDAERTVHQTTEPLLTPYAEQQPEDTRTRAFAVSPDYEDDGTVFVSAGHPTRPVLFATEDGGASWVQRRALGFAWATKLFLSPEYPRDPRLFAVGGLGLQVSHDGGETFETLVPNPFGNGNPFLDASMSQSFGTGRSTLLLVVQRALVEYDADTGEVDVLSKVGDWADDGVFAARYLPDDGAGDSAGGRILVASTSVLDGGFVRQRVGVCTRAAAPLVAGAPTLVEARVLHCEEASGPAWSTGGFQPAITSASSAGDPIYAFNGVDVVASPDLGRTFDTRSGWGEENRFTGRYRVVDLTVVPGSGHATVVASLLRRWTTSPALLRTDDGGRTWSPLSIDVPGFELGVGSVAVAPTGRMFAASLLRGVACSADGGRTWAATCATPERG